MDAEARVVEDSISSHGLRTVHVVGYNHEVPLDDWMHLVPGESIDILKVSRLQEPEIGIYHLRLYWNAREMVEFQSGVLKYGVLWYVNTGERLRDAIDLATSLYRLAVGVYPRDAWTRSLPEGAPKEMEITGIRNEIPGGPVTLHEAAWVPPRYVCTGIPMKEATITWQNGAYLLEKVKK